jgi:hypothetical protein
MQSMWEIWIAAGASALYFAQVAIVARLNAVRVTLTSWARTAFVGGILFIGVLAASALGPVAAVMAGVGLNVFIGGRMLMTTRRAARVKKLLGQVEGPDATRALAALDREVEGLRGGRGGEKSDYEYRARWVLGIAANVGGAGHPRQALEWIARLEPTAMGRVVATMHAQHEAVFRTTSGDRDGARQAIARVPRPAMAPWEDALQALEALLEALDGDAAAAVERSARALDTAATGPSRVTWQMARAHALARAGAVEDAREVIRVMRNEEGAAPLRRLVAHDGPASRLAEVLLAERGAYR